MKSDSSDQELYKSFVDGETKKNQPTDDGKPRKRKKRNQHSDALRGSIGASKVLFHAEEKEMQQRYRKELIAQVMLERNKVTIKDEIHIDLLCIAMIRVYRKSRLESQFNRFADRICSQDPIAQVNSCLKELKLNNEITAGGSEAELIARLINNNASEKKETHEEWAKKQLNGEEKPTFKRRNMAELDIKEED